MQYRYRINGLQKTDAQTVGEICERLENSAGGLSPCTLLDEARPETSVIHNEFEWDDNIAAERYRLTQAQGVLRNIVIVRPEVEVPVRAFVKLTCSPVSQYTSTVKVLNSEEMTLDLLHTALREMRAFEIKYGALKQLAPVIEAIRGIEA